MPDQSLGPAVNETAEESYSPSDLSALDLDKSPLVEGSVPDAVASNADHETLHRRRSTEIFLDFQWKSIVQTIDVMSKGIGFYFVVLLGVTGAIYQAKVAGAELTIAIVTITLITVVVCTACGFLIWGVVSGLADVQDTLESLHPRVFAERRLGNYFRRARTAARATITCSLCIALTIIAALVMLRYR
jgi:hypothetical protein